MTGATMFSGIGAPEQALPEIDWLWCAEIEPFPSTVLKCRHPSIPNLGDVNADDFAEWAGKYGPIGLLVAGAPCQDFSVAGRRAGMAGTRGSLSLRFIELVGILRPAWLLFENVPGLISSVSHIAPNPCPPPDNLQPGQEWTTEDDYEADEGSDFGFFLAALSDIGYSGFSWTIVDAQYFGLAQRRERLFVVASLGSWTGPAAVLFDRESLSGNSAPSREAGQGVTRTAPSSFTPSQHGAYKSGVGTLRANGGDYGGGTETLVIPDVSMALNAHGGSGRIDGESETFIAHALRADGFDASEDGTGRGTPLVATPILEVHGGSSSRGDGPNGVGIGEPGDPMYTLQSGKQHTVAFHENQRAEVTLSDTIGTLKVCGGKPGQGYPAIAFTERGRPEGRNFESQDELAYCLTNPGSGGRTHSRQVMTPQMGVRRLTPRECERVQGFPDDYTLIPYRKKLAADGPRYKALGNSMAVPCIRWIGRRILEAIACR